MRRLLRPGLLAVVVTLVMMGLLWGVALADDPLPAAPTGEIYYRAAENLYSLHDTRLESCALCHTVDGTGAVTAMNSYGTALLDKLKESVPTAAFNVPPVKVDVTSPVTITNALKALESLDSDGDGTKNSVELWALSFPGDADDEWVSEPATTAFAVGPHGGYGETPEQCAQCHRTHTAQAPILLVQSQQNLCYTCHGFGSAATDVRDGVGRDGILDEGLRAGGFEQAKMQTKVDGTTTVGAPTSTHTVDGTAGIMWGSGARNATSFPGKEGVTLECGNCHDPHLPTWTTGTDKPVYVQYRMLKGSPRESGAMGENGQARGFFLSIPETVPGNTTPVTSVEFKDVNKYVQTYTADERPDTSYQPNDRIGEFCALCHTRYMAGTVVANSADSHGSTTGHTDSGDAVFAYQHATKEASCSTCHVSPPLGQQPPADADHKDAWSRPRCLDCHVGHGTVATMAGAAKWSGLGSTLADGSFWPGGATPGGSQQLTEGKNRSSLLRLNNRGVCTSCHEK